MDVVVAVVGIRGFNPSLWDNSSLQRVRDVLLRNFGFCPNHGGKSCAKA